MAGVVGKACKEPGCPGLATGKAKYCPAHSKKDGAFGGSARERAEIYKTAAWQKARKAKLALTPLCEQCGDPAIVVHHRLQVRLVPGMAFAPDNLEALCARCHNRESQRQSRGK